MALAIGKKFSFRISTKLAAMSAVGILMVSALLFVMTRGNDSVEGYHKAAVNQLSLARVLAEAKASLRGLQVGVRDVRLATSSENLQAAQEVWTVG